MNAAHECPDPSLHLAVLSEGVANAADLEVLLGHLHLAAHRPRLAGVLAIRVRVAGLEEHLVLLAFSAQKSVTWLRFAPYFTRMSNIQGISISKRLFPGCVNMVWKKLCFPT